MKACPTCRSTYPQDFAMCPRDGTRLEELGVWSEGTVVRGKYRILAKVGEGGMGAVYKALHLRFNELRALKVISAQLSSDPSFISRFEKEAVLTRKLQHPNAVRVDDIDEAEDGRPFIVMEYIEGQVLTEAIRTLGALPVRRACSIVTQVASALEAAHRLGIIHRDIKPQNVVLVATPGSVAAREANLRLDEIAKVLDFGIAKMKEAGAGKIGGLTQTETGVIIGSPPYMSPEQAMGLKGDQLDGRSDLYSLGVVMYQMLTGEFPLKADTTMSMLMAHIQSPPIPIRQARPDLLIPDAIATLVMSMLGKKPESRPPSAQAVIEALRSAGLAGETIVAPVSAAIFRESVQLEPTRVVRSREFSGGTPAGRPANQSQSSADVKASPGQQPETVQERSATITRPVWTSFVRRYGVFTGILLVALALLGWRIRTKQPTSPPAQLPQPATVHQQSFEESHQRGHDMMKQGNYSGAIIEFKHALELRPDLDEARLDYALALEAKGLKQQAYEEFEVVCARTPDVPECSHLQRLKKELKDTGPLP